VDVSIHPTVDKGEVAIDFPDKYYSDGFGHDCSFEARAEDDGVLIRSVHGGSDRRAAANHRHHFLLAGILEKLACSLTERTPIDVTRRQPLLAAAQKPAAALERAGDA
jgi:hypothetical protein